jgi:hypothetical protein
MRPGWTRARRWLVVISAFLILVIACALLLGVWLIIRHSSLWFISRPFLLIHLTLAAVGLRDHQRAEYLADSIAADVAGTAAVSLNDQMLYYDTTMNIVRHGAETGRPTTWHASIAGHISRDAAQLARCTWIVTGESPVNGVSTAEILRRPDRRYQPCSPPDREARDKNGIHEAIHVCEHECRLSPARAVADVDGTQFCSQLCGGL